MSAVKEFAKVMDCPPSELFVASPYVLNLQFEIIQSMFNRKLRVKCHADENNIFLSRDAKTSLKMSTTAVYEVQTPNGYKFCFNMKPAMFGPNYTLAFKKDIYYNVVRELRELVKDYFKIHEVNGRNPDMPILDEAFIKDIEDQSIVYLKILMKYKHLNLKGCRGLLLTGSPGNGKTMLCRYLKNQAYANGWDVAEHNAAKIDAYYAKDKLASLFTGANLIFFDDVDINYFSRKVNGKQSCSVLSAMDGLNKSSGCIRIFSTNEDVADMDPAFLRPGRIDRVYKFEKPNDVLRKRFIQDWKYDELEVPNLDDLVVKTNDFSFAELAELRNELLLGKLVYNNFDVEKTVSSMNSKKQERKVLGFK